MGFLPIALPFAELEVGQHLYWQIGNLQLHGQVFMTSWIVIGAILALVVVIRRIIDFIQWQRIRRKGR